jgi:hypothetical protein
MTMRPQAMLSRRPVAVTCRAGRGSRIRPRLTPRAAEGLLIIMAGAVSTTLMVGGGAQGIVPAVTALLLTTIAYGRSRTAPVPAR